MTSDKKQCADPKDGFDFIEYPCDYPFKAMCRVAEDAQQELTQIVISELGKANLQGVRVRQSRTAKFESITVTARLSSRQQLETIYEAISSCSKVLMTL